MVDLQAFFERAYVVNLDRRPDRWEHVQRSVVPNWPLAPLQRFAAIDGQKAPPPPWWGAGPGAWGVYRSHVDIIEKCLNEDVRSVIILEDDAVLVEQFTEKAALFLEAVPADWGMIYLGGQHLHVANHPPERVNDLVFRPWNVNRLHAFAVAKPHMSTIYRWLTRREWLSHPGRDGRPIQDHVDHHLGRLHMSRQVPIYSPAAWLIDQKEGQSNICGKLLPRRHWKGADMSDGQQVVAVVGTYRSGTSCVAGMLHNLGASMGQRFFQGRKSDSPKGCFEALPLHQLCMRAYGEPNFKEGNNYRQRIRDLRQWLGGRWNQGAILGAKHPKFCFMVPEIMEAWPTAKLIVVDRPLEESVASLVKARWWHAGHPQRGKEWAHQLLTRMLTKRDADLVKVPAGRILRLAFADVIADPRGTAERLASFAGLSPTPAQIAAAVAHADESLYRNRLPQAAPLLDPTAREPNAMAVAP